MSGQLFTRYYLTEGIKSTTRSALRRRQTCQAFGQGVRPPLRRPPTLTGQPKRGRHRAGAYPPGAGSCLDGPTTCRSRARPATRTSPICFCSPTRTPRRAPPATSNPDQRYARRAGGRGEQAVRTPPRRPRRGRSLFRARTPHGQILRYLAYGRDTPTDGGDPVGHPYQRRRMASLRPARASPRHRLPRGRSRRRLPARRRRRVTHVQPVVPPRLLRPGGRARPTPFLERALEEGRRYEQQVARDLSRVVFERAFPGLAQALADTGNHRSMCRSGRRRSFSSTGCCSCSTPRTAVCCPSTTPATTTTGCAHRCAITSPAA